MLHSIVIITIIILTVCNAFIPKGSIMCSELTQTNKNAIMKRYSRVSTKMQASIPLSRPDILTGTLLKYARAAKSSVGSITVAWRAIIILFTAFIGRARNKVQKQITKATNTMESGWFKRGYGSSFSRTVEVWTFTIYFIFRWLQTLKLKKRRSCNIF